MVIAFPRRTETGEFVERTLSHEGNALPKFYAALEGPVPVGIEATEQCSGSWNCWKSWESLGISGREAPRGVGLA